MGENMKHDFSRTTMSGLTCSICWKLQMPHNEDEKCPEGTVKELEERVESLEWAIRQALATPKIGELATSILKAVIKPKQ